MLKPIHVIVFFTLFLSLTTLTGHPDYYYARSPLESVEWTCLVAAQWWFLVWLDHKIIDVSQTKYPSLDQLGKRVLFSYPHSFAKLVQRGIFGPAWQKSAVFVSADAFFFLHHYCFF